MYRLGLGAPVSISSAHGDGVGTLIDVVLERLADHLCDAIEARWACKLYDGRPIAPELEGWERDVFLAVREESFYFQPVFATQVMNEGWASYWHARLLREASFLPQDSWLDAAKCHSDVVRPYASGEHVALSVNPYHLGFSLWDTDVEFSI